MAGATDLVGAVISNTADPTINSLTTSTLSASDLAKSERYKASSVNISAPLSGIGGSDTGGSGSGSERDADDTSVPAGGDRKTADIATPLGNLAADVPTFLGASGNQNSVTNSAIADRTISITSGDGASGAPIAGHTDLRPFARLGPHAMQIPLLEPRQVGFKGRIRPGAKSGRLHAALRIGHQIDILRHGALP